MYNYFPTTGISSWSGNCVEGGFTAFSAQTSLVVFKSTTCSTDLCNNLEDLKYLENATLCSDGFYSDSVFTSSSSTITTTQSNQLTSNVNTSFQCYSSQYSSTTNSFIAKICNGTNNYCVQYVNIFFNLNFAFFLFILNLKNNVLIIYAFE